MVWNVETSSGDAKASFSRRDGQQQRGNDPHLQAAVGKREMFNGFNPTLPRHWSRLLEGHRC